jgi:CMP-N-acetylneuraminic acid synthetase
MTDRPTTIALLPMKGHSERVPGKNFLRLGDKPLYRWVLGTLLEIDRIATVVINTDAEELLGDPELAENPRVVVRRRIPELCGDLVSMNRVLMDDVDHTEGDVYLMTHATNPLLSADTIRAALARFDQGDADSLFSVTRVQTRFYRRDASPVNHDPAQLIRTQDLEPWYEENSCLYLFTREAFLATGARIGRKPVMFETPRLESIDIDDPDDWTMAEALVEHRFRE